MHEPVYLSPLPPQPFIGVCALGMAAAGVRLVEIGAWHNAVDLTDMELVARVRRLLDDAGVEVYSYHPPFAGEYDVSVLDDPGHARAVERNVAHLRSAGALGARYYILHPGDKIPEGEQSQRLERVKQAVRRLANVAQETGVALAVENMPPGFLAVSAGDLMEIVESAGSDLVGVCFDTGHAHVASCRMSDYLRAVGADRLFTIHWHDNDGSKDQHLPPGAGTIDWKDFFDTLADMGWQRPICPEMPIPPDWTYREWVQRLRAALAAPGPLVALDGQRIIPRR
ncbi:MAG: sugar phosphate isomerase/epimerase [Armatimonadetes bacterium]|nr:sugar phosphate isomerase/epimerase [Armatimonadota bacterium]